MPMSYDRTAELKLNEVLSI